MKNLSAVDDAEDYATKAYADSVGGGGGLTNPIAAGTAAAPSINFASATTSGFYSAAANTVAVAANGYRVADFSTTGTGVNYFNLVSQPTGTGPTLYARGSDTNVSLNLVTQGLASTSFGTLVSGTFYQTMIFGCDSTPTGATNYPQFSAVNAGSYPYLSAAGGDTNIGMDFYGKGTGPIRMQSSLQVQGNKTLTVQGVKSVANTSNSAAINTTATYITPAFAIPANSLNAGDSFEITIQGTCTSTAANVSTFTVRMGTAGTTADTSVLALTCTAANSGTNIPFSIRAIVVVRTTGAPGTAVADISLMNKGVTGVSAVTNTVEGLGATANITTTGTLYLGVTYSSAAATTTCTFRNMTIRKIL